MVFIYTKEKYPKFLFDINLDLNTALEVTNNNLFIDNPQYNINNTIVVEREDKFLYPISDDLIKIREMTREEICTTGDLTVLNDGEKFQDGEILTVEEPKNKYLTYVWDKKTFKWELATTKEELMVLRKEKILKYADLKKEITTLEDFEEEFESDGTIDMLKKNMEELRVEIGELLQIIKEF